MELAMKTSLVIRRILMTLGALAIVAFLFLVFAPGSDGFHHLARYESAAASSLRTIDHANLAYANDHPQQGYSRNLSDLAKRLANAKPGEDADWMIDSVLASGEKGGYRFTYSSQSTKGDGKIDVFQVTADPLIPGKTGRHHFFVDQTGVIRMSYEGPANASSVALQ